MDVYSASLRGENYEEDDDPVGASGVSTMVVTTSCRRRPRRDLVATGAAAEHLEITTRSPRFVRKHDSVNSTKHRNPRRRRSINRRLEDSSRSGSSSAGSLELQAAAFDSLQSHDTAVSDFFLNNSSF